MLGRRRTWEVAWFTTWQASGEHRADARRRHRPGVRARPVPVRRPAVVARAPHRRVRVADGRDGRGVLALLPASLDRSIWAILGAHVVFNLAVVVRTVGAVWEHLPPDLEAAAATLGAQPVARVPRDHPSAAAAGAHRGRRDRVPVHVHVVRRHPHPRDRRPADARGRDLAAGDAARRDRTGGRARPRPTRRPRRRGRLVDVQPAPAQPRPRRAAARRRRGTCAGVASASSSV